LRKAVILLVPTLTLLLIAILCPVSVFAEHLFDIDGVQMNPSQLHEIMANRKAEALQRSRDAGRLTASAAANTQTNYDILSYDIFIRVNDTTEILYGSVGFVANAVESGVNEVEVDFYSGMSVDSIVSPTGILSYSRAGSIVTVVLDGTYNTDEQFEFVFYYHGHPTEGGFQAFSFGWYGGRRSISSLSEPYFARTWWPCKDRMDDKADSFKIAIEVDTSLYVASNGSLDSVVAGGDNSHIYYYTEHYPMVTYLFSVAIHPFTVWTNYFVYNSGLDSMPIVHAVYPDKYTYSLGKYNITPQAIEVLSANYGEYPFLTEKYGHANFNWGGGMEHQTMTSMGGSGSFAFSEPVVVHEAAHQWWGDMITCESWEDIWLNEGWASYSEALYYYHINGWESYISYMNGMAYYGGGSVFCDDTTSVWRIFNGPLSYDKGAWVAHMLRGTLGDSLFFEGIDAYYHSEYQHGAATTEKFKNVWEAATGVELDWFFDQWVYGEYYPRYSWQYTYEWAGHPNYNVYVWISQTQTTTPRLFQNPIDIFFDYSSIDDDTVRFKVEEREQVFKFTVPSTVLDAELDPAGWILKSSSEQPWSMHIVTFQEEISEALQLTPYMDTIDVVGGSGSNTVTVTDGALPGGFSIDNNGVISGSTNDTGLFTFTVDFDDNGTNYRDDEEFSIYVAFKPLVPGDVAFDDGKVDLGDLTRLIDYLFISFEEPPVLNLADVNADCFIDLGDLTYLIAYLFIDGELPLMGCVN